KQGPVLTRLRILSLIVGGSSSVEGCRFAPIFVLDWSINSRQTCRAPAASRAHQLLDERTVQARKNETNQHYYRNVVRHRCIRELLLCRSSASSPAHSIAFA